VAIDLAAGEATVEVIPNAFDASGC